MAHPVGVPGKALNDPFTEAMWDTYIAANQNALGNHRSMSIYRDTDHSVPTSTTNVITWTNTSWNDIDYFSISGTAITVQESGFYDWRLLDVVTTGASTIRLGPGIRKNGAVLWSGHFLNDIRATGRRDSYGLGIISLAANDVISIAYQNTDATYVGTVTTASLQAVFLGTA